MKSRGATLMSDAPQTETERPGKPDKPKNDVTILVNNRPVALVDDRVTGNEIKAAAELPSEFKVYDDKGREISDDERIKVKEGDRFTAISGQDVS
jgi:hypothetical protein